METVAIDDIEASATGWESDRRGLSDALGTTDVAINRYTVTPGGRLGGGLHAHGDQEEVFVVVDGEATFETMDGDVVVGAGEAVRFAPGEYQSGRNDSDRPLTVFALGAPRDSDDVRIPLACSDCDYGYLHPSLVDGAEVLLCPECGAESSAACPDCGRDAMFATIPEDEAEPVGLCRNCGVRSNA